MPLGPNAYPAVDDNGKTIIVDPDNPGGVGQYEVDPSTGYALMPEGPFNPDWNNRGKFAQPTPATQPRSSNPSFTPMAPAASGLPSVDIQPGLAAQQWEGTYNLSLAQEKRLREVMETITQPNARSLIDQAIQALHQKGFENETNLWESQRKSSGFRPQWLPQPPKPMTGAWRQYQTGGMVTPPGMGGTTPATGEKPYDTINGVKTVAQMEAELKVANWPGGEDVPTAYARTTGGPVTPRGA